MLNTRDNVSSASPTPSGISSKNSPLFVVFSTLFWVFGFADETLSLLFNILRLSLRKILGQVL